MLLSKMKKHIANFGSWTRPDGEIFDISSTLYESPSDYDYWLAHYVAIHATWGTMRFTLTIPKSIASTTTLASALIGGAPLDQVKSELGHATSSGREFRMCPSLSGWILV